MKREIMKKKNTKYKIHKKTLQQRWSVFFINRKLNDVDLVEQPTRQPANCYLSLSCLPLFPSPNTVSPL